MPKKVKTTSSGTKKVNKTNFKWLEEVETLPGSLDIGGGSPIDEL